MSTLLREPCLYPFYLPSRLPPITGYRFTIPNSEQFAMSDKEESKVAWVHCGYTTHGARGVPLPLFVQIYVGKPLPITQSLQDCASVRVRFAYKSRAILEDSRRHLGFFRTEKLHSEGAQSAPVRLRRYLMKLPLHVCVATTRRWQKHSLLVQIQSTKAIKPQKFPKIAYV